MPTPNPLPLELTEAEKEGLEKLIKRHRVGQQIALQMTIVLAAGSGQNDQSNSQRDEGELGNGAFVAEHWLDLQPKSG